MLAYHPITKKEIRILNSDASISKKRKTLFVGKNHTIWDTVFEVKEGDTEFASFPICLESISIERLKEISEAAVLVFIKQDVIQQIMQKNSIRNLICLEEMAGLYPHLGPVWDGTAEDAYFLVAGLLQYKVLVGNIMNKRSKWIPIEISNEKPMRLWWVTQYYTPDKAKRSREINTCLRKNLQSPLIDKVICLNEKNESFSWLQDDLQKKLEEKVVGHRLTYKDVLEEVLRFPDDVIVAFGNADICIDSDSWRQLWEVDVKNVCLALLRYDVPESGSEADAKLFGPRADSQDTWVVRAKDVKQRGEAILKNTEIRFGQMGCDNAFALEIFRHKFLVVNPSYSLKTFHYHSSNVRNYKTDDVVHNPVFMYCHPSGFHDLEPVLHFSQSTSVKPSMIPRVVMGSGGVQWVERMNRSLQTGTESWKLQGQNPLTPHPEQVLHLQNCFQNENGLSFDTSNMYIGKGARSQKKWSESALKRLPVTIESQQGLIVPFDKEVMESRERYIVEYVSRVLRLRALANQGGEFFCPDKKEILDALNMFHWETSQMPLLKYEKDVQIWHHKAVAFPVSENSYILQEDIEALRKACKMWNPVVETFANRLRLVIVVDGTVITEELLAEYEEVLERAWDVRVIYAGKTSSERMWDILRGAWGIVIGGGCGLEVSGWNWLLPKEAVVVEVQGSLPPNATALHMSSVSGLEHRFIATTDRDTVFTEIWNEYEQSSFTQTSDSAGLPVVYLPRKDLEGYFAHAGDSFREMARLWAKRGYCRVKEHATATQCWWGDVGAKGVLLYDRPLHDWRLAGPLPEKEYAFAFFGNPKPPMGDTKASPWFFWPRRPELVEELVQEGVHDQSWMQRKQGPNFYGKIENRIQEKRRTKHDWSQACEEYVMVRGDETYALTHEEYLKKLAGSRFGLCLAGYGSKCHREVECMAMGCVPVVAPEVDMESYAEPPIEGIHYIRVQTPDEAKQVVSEIGEEQWKTMSQACKAWWKRNCSCEGSFALTKKLIEAHK
jgi:hypothetical protein